MQEELSVLKHLSWIFGAALVLAASTSNARATAFTLNCNQSGTCSGAFNFGTVNVTQFDANTMQFSITLASGDQFVTTGTHHAFGFNITGSPAINVTDLTAGYAFAGAGSNPSYGAFGYVIDCTGCGPGGSSPIGGTLSFKVSRTGGGAFPIGLLTTNAGGFSFSADILIPGTDGPGSTGVVASNADPGGGVPEPTTIGLSALGLGALLLARKRIAS